MLASFYLYIRVSTEDQDSIAQKLEADKFIEQNPHFQITKVYQEKCSAWNQIPGQLIRLILDIESLPLHERPHVLVKCVDRFSRSMDYGTQCLEKILSLGVEILFFDTPTINVRTENGRLMFNELLSRSQGYSDQISAKVRDSLSVRRENGLATTKNPVFGTKFIVGVDGRNYVEQNDEEYTIQAIIAMLNGNYTNNDIMKAIRVYEATFKKPHIDRTMYDHDFVPYSERYNIYYGTDRTFSEILNYFRIFKRGEEWTPSSVNYQWNKYIKNNAEEFDNFVQSKILTHDVPYFLLEPWDSLSGSDSNIPSLVSTSDDYSSEAESDVQSLTSTSDYF